MKSKFFVLALTLGTLLLDSCSSRADDARRVETPTISDSAATSGTFAPGFNPSQSHITPSAETAGPQPTTSSASTLDSPAASAPATATGSGTSPAPSTVAAAAPSTTGPPGDSGLAGPNGLDGDSARWFTALCTAIGSLTEARTQIAAINVGDSADMQAAMIGVLSALATTYVASAAEMKQPPGLAISRETAFIDNTVSGVTAYGNAFTQVLSTLEAADPADTTAQATAVGDLDAATQQIATYVSAFDALAISTQTHEAIRNLTECRAVLS
jgi:hypothetical protein